jgi:predicted amidohydrolase YtcJ
MMNQTVSQHEVSTIARLADCVIRAGAIYSMAADRKVYRAIAIRDEWIVAVSEDQHGLDGLITSGTNVVDEPKLTLIPAFFDTHNHFIIAARNMGKVPADLAHSIAELVELIRKQAAQTPSGQWIQTVDAWHESNLAEGRLPTALELDQATREHPVWVKRGGHIGVANSLALKLANITRDTPDPKGATIKRFPDGTPNGILLEAPAWMLVSNLIPQLSTEQLAKNLKQACQMYNALGIGAVRDPIVSRDELLAYQLLRESGELTVRCQVMYLMPRGPVASIISDIASLGVRSGLGDNWLSIWGLKTHMDGGAEGAALDQPYSDAPNYSGNLYWKVDDLVEVANHAVRHGWKIGAHTVGDSAVRHVLDAYERIIAENPGIKQGMLVMEHGMLANAEQRARAIKLGIPITVQQSLLYALGAEFLTRWGEERLRQAVPIRAWLEEGANISAGTDYPASSYDPMLGLWGMVTRGTQKVGVQGPEHAVDQYTAVQLYTAAGAQLIDEGNRRGTLQAGRLADLTAFRADPITCPIDELPTLRPIFTLVGGQAVYDPESMLSEQG